jgi:hypothetical protein
MTISFFGQVPGLITGSSKHDTYNVKTTFCKFRFLYFLKNNLNIKNKSNNTFVEKIKKFRMKAFSILVFSHHLNDCQAFISDLQIFLV